MRAADETIRTSSSDVSSNLGQRVESELEVDRASSHYQEQLEHHVDGSGLEESESVSAVDGEGHALEQRSTTEVTPDGRGETTTATRTDSHRWVFTKTVLTGAAIGGALALIAAFKPSEPPPPPVATAPVAIETAPPVLDPITTTEPEVPTPSAPSRPLSPRNKRLRSGVPPHRTEQTLLPSPRLPFSNETLDDSR
jgi:hypothetical protein